MYRQNCYSMIFKLLFDARQDSFKMCIWAAKQTNQNKAECRQTNKRQQGKMPPTGQNTTRRNAAKQATKRRNAAKKEAVICDLKLTCFCATPGTRLGPLQGATKKGWRKFQERYFQGGSPHHLRLSGLHAN